MCGIYGYIGKNSITEVMNGIKRLEYRGYDSAGIAYFNDGEPIKVPFEYKGNTFESGNLKIIKAKGRIAKLEEIVRLINPKGGIAIGHTRWATHGKPSIINSHPHMSEDGQWAIVHNGIIENYIELKKLLKGINLKSETDTEVVAGLLQKYYDGDELKTLAYVASLLKGSYAFAVLSKRNPDKIFVAKKASPVVVGYGKDYGVVCSDINSMNCSDNMFVLEDNNFAVVEKGGVKIYDEKLCEIVKNNISLSENISDRALGRYRHYMMKEIAEIPDAIIRTIREYNSFDKIRKALPLRIARNVKRILIIGCGTAYHAGLVGKKLFEEGGIPCDVELASEFRYNKYNPSPNTLAIFVSQSGETADTIKALQKSRDLGMTTLCITNVKNSSICFEADRVIYTMAGKEIGVASTKAYNCQLAIFYLLSAYFTSLKLGYDEVERESFEVLRLVEETRKKDIRPVCKKIAEEIYKAQSIYMIGRGLDYDLALEASLKLKEISYIHSEAYPAGELKHGTISLIDKDTFVFAFVTQEKTKDKTLSGVSEVIAREGKVILVTNDKKSVKGIYKRIIIPSVPDRFVPLFAVKYMQLIAYYTAVKLGNNPDKPRSLAKSVTVE